MKTRSQDTALFAAGLIFAIVALAHMVRIFTHFNLIIARQIIPEWVSYPAFGIFLLLAVWMFMAREKETRKKK